MFQPDLPMTGATLRQRYCRQYALHAANLLVGQRYCRQYALLRHVTSVSVIWAHLLLA